MVRQQSRSSRNFRANNRCARFPWFQPRRGLRGSSKTRDCVDENCVPNRATVSSENHAIRRSHPADQNRRRAVANRARRHARQLARSALGQTCRTQLTSVAWLKSSQVSFLQTRPGPNSPGSRPRRRCSGQTPAAFHPVIWTCELLRTAKQIP